MTSDSDKTHAELLEEIDRLKGIIENDPFRSLFDAAPLPYHSLDEQGRILVVNRAWLNMLGYELDKVVGRWFGEFLTPESADLLKERFPKFMDTGEVSGKRFTMIHRDGRRVQVAIDGKIGHDAGEGFNRTHCILHDITQKQQAEEKIKSSEERFRGLFESSLDGILYCDTGRTVLSVNPALCAMLGAGAEHLLGKNMQDITPDQWHTLDDWVLKDHVLVDGASDEFEKELWHQGGHAVPVAIRMWLNRDGNGEATGIWLLVRDLTEQKAAVESAALSEERYRLLAEHSEDVIWTVDNEFNYTYVSPSVERLRGFTVDEVMATNFAEALPAESREKFFQAHQFVLDNEARGEPNFVGREELVLHHKNSSLVWVEVVARPMTDDSGTRIGFMGVTRNIAERKQAEMQLREHEATLKALLDATTDSVGMFGVDGTILTINQNMADVLGVSAEKIIGDNILTYLPDEVAGGRKQMFEQALETKVSVNGQDVRRGRIIDSVYYPVLDDNGEVTSVALYARDVTETILNAEARKQSEQQYRRIVETANEGIIGLDAQSVITYANKNTAKFFGYPLAELIGLSINTLLLPEDWQQQTEYMERRSEGLNDQYERQFVRKDGRLVWGLVSATPLLAEDGALLGAFAMITDITERKQAEEALRLTQYSVDNAPIDIYWINASGRFVYVNDQMCESLGYTREELLQLTVSDVNMNLGHEDWIAYWLQRRKHKVKRFEVVHRRKDGSRFPTGITSHYREYDDQELLFCFAYDLTERYEKDEMLRRSQDLLNEVQRISLTGGWEIDMESGLVIWTEGQYRLLDMRPEERPMIIDEYLEKLVHPEDRELVADAWTRVLETKDIVESEYRVVRSDGGEAVFINVSIPEINEDGELHRVYGSTRDVTRERQSAEELKQAHERLLAILDSIDADVYVSDIDSHEILFINAHMRNTFGNPADGIPCYQVFRNEDAMCSHCRKPDLLDEEGTPVGTLVNEGFNPLTRRWYLNHDRAIRWLEGRLVHMHMAADITDLKTMEEELKYAMAEAEAASLAKNEFLANMSHEIRTPLNGLLGMLQILQLTSLVEEQRDYLDTALESGRSLLQILNDILDLSKIESGKLELDEYDFELGEVLDSVVSVFRHPAQSRGLEMSWTIDDSLPRHFVGDKGRLRQILFNLVGNAAKFTDSGSVTVEAYPMPHELDDGRVRIYFCVTDTGIGVPDDKVECIFDPFIQVDGSFTRKYQGTGLGLGIVHRLVSLMNGTISVDAEEGRGTSIVFTVAARPSRGTAKSLTVSPRPEENASFSILVAEDERVNRAVVQRLLGKIGHTVTCVENGEAALDILGEQSFDCILMDIQMPGLNGLETTRAIRKKMGIATPVIALTAHAMKGDRERFMEAGMNGYVAKPFELAELKKELERVMALGQSS